MQVPYLEYTLRHDNVIDGIVILTKKILFQNSFEIFLTNLDIGQSVVPVWQVFRSLFVVSPLGTHPVAGQERGPIFLLMLK